MNLMQQFKEINDSRMGSALLYTDLLQNSISAGSFAELRVFETHSLSLPSLSPLTRRSGRKSVGDPDSKSAKKRSFQFKSTLPKPKLPRSQQPAHEAAPLFGFEEFLQKDAGVQWLPKRAVEPRPGSWRTNQAAQSPPRFPIVIASNVGMPVAAGPGQDRSRKASRSTGAKQETEQKKTLAVSTKGSSKGRGPAEAGEARRPRKRGIRENKYFEFVTFPVRKSSLAPHMQYSRCPLRLRHYLGEAVSFSLRPSGLMASARILDDGFHDDAIKRLLKKL